MHADGSGPAYGEKLAAGDICGVLIDTNTGILNFSKNGKDLGVAFTEPVQFCDGNLYPAVSMLYKNESVEIMNPEKLPFDIESKEEIIGLEGNNFDLRFNPNKCHATCKLSNNNRTAK